MKNILILLFLIPLLNLNAQSRDIKKKIDRYTRDNVYSIDGDNLVVSAVIDNLNGTKQDLYIRVKNYFARAYNNANSVLQTDDKEAGVLIVKGLYGNVYELRMLGVLNTYLNVYHILRVDIKEGRVRIICSAQMWEEYRGNGELDERVKIVNYAPFTDKRFFDKGKQMEATLKLIDKMHESINELEEALTSGSLSIESQEW